MSAGERLHNLPRHGAVIADGTGFGKTKQCLVAAILLSLFAISASNALVG